MTRKHSRRGILKGLLYGGIAVGAGGIGALVSTNNSKDVIDQATREKEIDATLAYIRDNHPERYDDMAKSYESVRELTQEKFREYVTDYNAKEKDIKADIEKRLSAEDKPRTIADLFPHDPNIEKDTSKARIMDFYKALGDVVRAYSTPIHK